MCEKVGSKEVLCGVENVKLDGFPLKRIVADVFLFPSLPVGSFI